ncbi:MAG: response regulator [Rheinheimera sp.]|nr:response regulator [Rheinheimera sp.]
MANLLLIDDDQALTSMLTTYLEREGFQVEVANDGQAGLQAALRQHFDLVVLDVMMPGMDGITVLKRLRQVSDKPVLMLTARGDDIDKVLGLELGADDYVAKPCLPRELVARIRAILRRMQMQQQPDLQLQEGSLLLTPANRSAYRDGMALDLTGAEFSLLWLLISQAGRIVSKADLSLQGLGKTLTQYDRSIDVHISNIRQKLGPRADGQPWIEAIRSKGYQWLRYQHGPN